MCSIPEPVMLEKKPRLRNCVKCKEHMGTLSVRQTVYCTTCFQENVFHKFRGISKNVKAKVLLAFSGGPSSTALLHLAHSTKQREPFHALLNEYKVCFVDQQILGISVSGVQEKCDEYGFELIKRKIEDSVENFKEFYADLQEEGKFDIKRKLLENLVRKTAIESNCTHIYFGNTSTNTAGMILSQVCHGSGYSLAEIVSPCHEMQSLSVLRPLKDCSRKEIGIYNYLNQLECIDLHLSSGKSIDKLVDDFICGLEVGFPSTVSIIARTAKKLLAPNNEHKCDLCGYSRETSDMNLMTNVWEGRSLCYGCNLNLSRKA